MIYYLIGHLLGDFYFQSDFEANRKMNDKKVLYIHCFKYSVVMTAMTLLRMRIESAYENRMISEYLLTLIMVSLAHLIIDFFKSYITKIMKSSDAMSFMIDQLAHIISIVFIYKRFDQGFSTNSGEYVTILNYVFGYLLVGIPSSVVIRLILKPFTTKIRPKEDQSSENIEKSGMPNAGKYIGILERILLLYFFLTNMTYGVGLIFSIKAVSRFKRISDDNSFAEYFVIGNSLSLIATLFTYFIVSNFILFLF